RRITEEILAQPTTNPSIMDILNQASTLPAVSTPSPLATSDQSSVPAPLAPAVSSGTADLESRLPGNIPLGVSAAQTSDDNNQRSLTNPDQDLTGPKTGFLDRLKQVASSPSGISNILSGVGSSLALAAGGPKQKELAVEQEQIPLKQQQLENERAWRAAAYGVNQQNANTKQQVANTGAKTEQDKFAQGDAAMGVPEGTTRQMAETARQNMISNQQLRQEHVKQMEAAMAGEVMVPPGMGNAIGRDDLEGKSLPALQFTQQVANPYKLLGVKAQDLGPNGVWGVSPLTGRITRLGDSPSVARADAMMKRTQIPVNDAQGNILGWVNPQTQTYTSFNSVPGAAEATGTQSIPMKPTQSMATMGQMAQTIQA